MKTGPLIKDFLTFNQKEQHGIVVLLALFFILLFVTIYYPAMVAERQVDFSGFEKEIIAFEKGLAQLDSLETLKKKQRFMNYHAGYPTRKSDTGQRFHFEPKEVVMIELNAADTFELQRLSGIGPGFARRIVKYRERLGGFLRKSQVREVWGMDTARYNKIAENLVVNPDSVHRINLNTVTFKELMYHPYFPFEITKAIMIYRKDHKRFRNLDELRSVPGISDSTYKKIVFYLYVEKGQ